MNTQDSLIRMLKQLVEDMQVIQQPGSGYYSCVAPVTRYNKLLGVARELVGSDNSLIKTFEAIAETDPKDPGEKMKVMQSIRIETSQLIAFLESVKDSVS